MSHFWTLMYDEFGDDALRRNPPWYPQGREEGHAGIGRLRHHVPGYIERSLIAKRYPYECVEVADAERGTTITSYVAGGYALGTSSRPFATGAPVLGLPSAVASRLRRAIAAIRLGLPSALASRLPAAFASRLRRARAAFASRLRRAKPGPVTSWPAASRRPPFRARASIAAGAGPLGLPAAFAARLRRARAALASRLRGARAALI